MTLRIMKSSINWIEFAQRVPAAQETQFAAFKILSNEYLKRMLSIPPEPPQIDWPFYRQTLDDSKTNGMADRFETTYKNYTVPYPEDKFTHLVDSERAQVEQEIDEFVQESERRICERQEKIAIISSHMAYDEMTMEDYIDTFPKNVAPNFLERPTFWPHTVEEQPPPVGQHRKNM